jgi:hypothetical protein
MTLAQRLVHDRNVRNGVDNNPFDRGTPCALSSQLR